MKAKRSKTAATVAAYMAGVPPRHRAALQRLRRTIRAAAPDAVEVISYQMPAFRQGRLLVSYAAFQEHCTLFAGRAVTKAHAAELKGFELTASGGGIRFDPARPLPARLVTKIVKARLAENARLRKR
ncbi:MAG TPA: DUF1801 domain-containing protein [Candidatus Thermoplasmatota archaeon]|nr:DUF1801 domain-containing protein [Candidatus Thermoplasmatota archaeon]